MLILKILALMKKNLWKLPFPKKQLRTKKSPVKLRKPLLRSRKHRILSMLPKKTRKQKAKLLPRKTNPEARKKQNILKRTETNPKQNI